MPTQFYVYFVANTHNNVLYTGITCDLVRHIDEHKNKRVKGFAQKYNVDPLVYYEISFSIRGVIEQEKQLKAWSRKKKNALVRGVNPEWKEVVLF